MKAIWRGNLVIKDISVPVKLYSAIESQTFGFTLLCAQCHEPLHYQRYCQHCKKIIEWQDVDKGLKLPDGSYFVITQEKLESLKVESSDIIDVREFVPHDAIAPIYFNNHYYLAPDKVTTPGFFLLHETMISTATVAIAHCILREKEYMVAIHPYENGLLLTTLNYEYEIRPINAIEELSVSVAAQVTKKERELAEKLVKKMTKNTFDMTPFKDTFAEKLKEKIKRSAAGKKALAARAHKKVKEKPAGTLIDMLQESVEKVGKSAKKRAK